MACSPPFTRGGRAGQGRAGRGELAGVPGQEVGDLGDPGGDGLVPGAGCGDVGPAPQPLVGGVPAAGAADAGAGAEDQRPVRAVAGDAGPEGDHGDLLAVPGGIGVPDAAVAGLAAQLLPALPADRATIPVVVQRLHHLPGPGRPGITSSRCCCRTCQAGLLAAGDLDPVRLVGLGLGHGQHPPARAAVTLSGSAGPGSSTRYPDRPERRSRRSARPCRPPWPYSPLMASSWPASPALMSSRATLGSPASAR